MPDRTTNHRILKGDFNLNLFPSSGENLDNCKPVGDDAPSRHKSVSSLLERNHIMPNLKESLFSVVRMVGLFLPLFASACLDTKNLAPEPLPTNPKGVMQAAESLGPDALLVPIPSEDDTLVGKVQIPRQKDSFTEADFQANPCAEHLKIHDFKAERMVRDTRRFSTDLSGSAVVQVVKIGAAISQVTDYQYEFNVSRKLVADDTVDYAQCCSRLRGGCGSHFVRELYYGDGVYRLLRNVKAGVSAGVPLLAEASAQTQYGVLGEQRFRGFFAYKVKETPAPPPEKQESRVGTLPTDGGPDLLLPKTLSGAALLEQEGAFVLITTKSTEAQRANTIKAIGSARQKQRQALKNLLAGPPYNTPASALNERVEAVFQAGEELDAYQGDEGDWYLKMRYTIR